MNGLIGIFGVNITQKDHVLTYTETEGLALLGTYVYKEAIAGSRYGYPDFYTKCLEEKELGTAIETTFGESTITIYTNCIVNLAQIFSLSN